MQPLVDALRSYCEEENIQLHMPGHRQGKLLNGNFRECDFKFLEWDLTEVPGLDNLHAPEEAIYEAQNLAAKAFGAKKTYFSVNGSTLGIMSLILATCRAGDSLVVDRSCHRSVINGLLLANVEPIFVCGNFDEGRGYVMPAAEDELIKASENAVGVMITRPNYYGVAQDIRNFAKRLHKAGKFLLVDEAHGAHFGFHPDLPFSALNCGADGVVQSAHKTLPALNQGAFVHTNGSINKLDIAMSMLQTTSPSYPIMASLDFAREWLEIHADYSTLIDGIKKFKADLPEIFKIVEADDPTRLVIQGPIIGFQLERLLRSKYKIQVEMSDAKNITCILVPGDENESLVHLLEALKSIESDIKQNKINSDSLMVKNHIIFSSKSVKRVMTLRDATFSEHKLVPFKDSRGKIAGDYLTPYPPGIPVLCPGEIISDGIIKYVYDIMEMHGKVNGLTTSMMFPVVLAGGNDD